MNLYRIIILIGFQVFLAQALMAGEPLRTVASPAGIFGSGRTGGGGSYTPAFSPEGNYLVYLSEARNLVTNDNLSPYLNIYLYNLSTGSNTLVSVSPSGIGGGNDSSLHFSISSNAQIIAFDTSSTNFGQATRGGVCLRDVKSNIMSLTSSNLSAGAAHPIISPNGRRLYMDTSLYHTTRDVVARDLQNNTNDVLSFGIDCLCDDARSVYSTAHTTSPDGRFVVIESYTNGGDTNASPNQRLYVRDMETGNIFWASTNVASYFLAAGGVAPFNYYNRNVCMDATGRHVAFWAGINQSPIRDFVFVRDLQAETTTLLSTNGSAPAMTLDGRYVAYCDFTNVMVYDTQFGTNVLVSVNRDGTGPANGLCQTPVISADGRKVAFLSTAADLVTNAVNGSYQLYVRDLVAGTTRLVSVNTNGAGMCTDLESIIPAISPDGQRVAFETAAEDLVPGDLNQASDVFVRELATETTRLVSTAHPSFAAPATGPGFATKSTACVSSNGQRVVFTGSDGKLVANDTNGFSDVFVRDMSSGNISAPGIADKPMGDAVVSANGRFVAYTRRSGLEQWSNFGAGEIYRYDVETGSNVLASVATNGVPAEGCSTPSISPDGRYVAFQSRASNLVALGRSSYIQVYMRDMMLGSNILVSVNTSGGFGDNDSWQPMFSPDGRWLLFNSLSDNLIAPYGPGASGAYGSLYAWDMISNKVVLISTQIYFGQYLSVSTPSFSANSRYVTFANYVDQGSQIWMRDMLASNCIVVAQAGSTGPRCYSPSIDNSARFVVYEQGVRNGVHQVLMTDLQSHITNVISLNRYATLPGNNSSTTPLITPDGQFIVFASKASDLVWGDTNGVSDIFVRNRLRNITTLVSVNGLGQPGNGASTAPVLAGDGRTVIFQSFAGDLVDGDYNMKRDLFVLRLSAGDSDGDGLDDDWEMAYFGTLSRDGSGDYDGDGMTDRQEFLAGTSPTNRLDVLRVMTLNQVGGSTTRVLWPAAAGRVYHLQVKTNITDSWQDWPTLPTVSAGTAWVDVNSSPTNGQRRFYRAVAGP